MTHPERTDAFIRRIAYEAAGAASVPFMQDHPDYVMPSERIEDGVRAVLASYGIHEPIPEDSPHAR
jgi:hypothetical protein